MSRLKELYVIESTLRTLKDLDLTEPNSHLVTCLQLISTKGLRLKVQSYLNIR